MKDCFLIILLSIIVVCCNQTTDRTNLVWSEHERLELSENEILDTLYLTVMDNSRSFVIDSLNRNPADFQYELLQIHENGSYTIIVELYDKLDEVHEDSPFDDSTIYMRLNHYMDLHFDSLGAFQYDTWIADTDDELKEAEKMLREFEKEGS
ncbi:hypothetical protein IMPR6_380058 [Imperialibacter sp. EC-SDR9]|nr:hypothetical protein IMPERIA75_150003 [Imperialibacter sp. 75]CAD5266322.1 hypothetical protein IMPERIA89_310058 [Imperialibacter sp. 89]VVT23837.1 hypothetical protein IMPR6_380058 [Imperialibacter sp. EC-SDR9]